MAHGVRVKVGVRVADGTTVLVAEGVTVPVLVEVDVAVAGSVPV